MRIFEVMSPSNESAKLDFDLADDLIFFIRNDPNMYRKYYFPTIEKFKSLVMRNKKLTPKVFKKLINAAYKQYYTKYQVTVPILKQTLSQEEVEEICNKIHQEEMEFIKDEVTH